MKITQRVKKILDCYESDNPGTKANLARILMEGKLDGTSIRVPTPNVSVIDFKFVPKRKTTVEEVNAAFVEAAKGNALKGILGINTEPLVSSDFNHDSHSSTVDLKQTQVIEGQLVRVLSWYDNEWGFSNRMLDTLNVMGKLL